MRESGLLLVHCLYWYCCVWVWVCVRVCSFWIQQQILHHPIDSIEFRCVHMRQMRSMWFLFFRVFFLLFHLFHSFCCLFICWPIFSSSWCEYVSLIHSISRSLALFLHRWVMMTISRKISHVHRTNEKKTDSEELLGVFCLLIWCVCVRANKVKRRRRRRQKRKENKNRELSTHRVVEALFSGNTMKRQWRRQRQRQHETKFFHREYAKKKSFLWLSCLSIGVAVYKSLCVCVLCCTYINVTPKKCIYKFFFNSFFFFSRFLLSRSLVGGIVGGVTEYYIHRPVYSAYFY